MALRPLTLQDVIGIVNQNVQRALNPTPTSAQILDVLVVGDETIAETDSVTITPATPATAWGSVLWNQAVWG